MNREVNTTHLSKYFETSKDRERVMPVLARVVLFKTKISVCKSKGSHKVVPLRHFNIDDAVSEVEKLNKDRNEKRPVWHHYDDILEKFKMVLADVNKFRPKSGLIPDTSDVWEKEIRNISIAGHEIAKDRRIVNIRIRDEKRGAFRKLYHGTHRDCSVSLGEDF